MTEIENLLSMLGLDKLSDEKQEKVKDILKKIIDKWRQGENSEAYSVMNGMMAQLLCDTLDEAAQVEIRDKFMELISREAGFSKKDFIFEFGGAFNNPNVTDIRETTSSGDAQGPDSNRQGDAYSKVIGSDGLQRRKPKKRKYDDEEEDVISKLEKLKKLFQNRSSKDISIDDIRKVLTSESKEQQLAALQYLQEAQAVMDERNDCGVNEQQVLDFYFNESSPLTSTFSHTAWSGFKYVHLNKDNQVTATNSFMVKVGNTLSKERILELQNIGIKIYFGESLNEAFQKNDSILDDMTYDELLDTVYSNLENPDERSIMKEFDKLLTMKVKDAKFEMKRAVKQILKDTQE